MSFLKDRIFTFPRQFSITLQCFKFQKYEETNDFIDGCTVAILRIKTSPIPHEEKQERIAQVKSEKIEKLRQILSVEQFDKWYGAYLENEIFNKTQRK